MNYNRNANKGSLFSAKVFVLTSISLLYSTTVVPIRYPEENARDLQMIGKDMWVAMKKYDNAKEEIATTS